MLDARVAEYRDRAEVCRSHARVANDAEAKAEWVKLAEDWEALAIYAAKRPHWFSAISK
jgi:hypothetical protein